MSTDERRTPILVLAQGLIRVSRWLTLECYLRFLFPDLRARSDVPAAERVGATTAHRYAIAYDYYVFFWIALDATLLLIAAYRPTATFLVIAQGLALSRIIDLVRTGLNASLFNQATGRDELRVESAPGLVVLALLAYVELMACFAIIYAAHRELLIQAHGGASSVPDAILFAALTQMTISFGTQYPQGWLRFVAAIQAFFGLVLVALIISRVISSLRPIRSVDDR